MVDSRIGPVGASSPRRPKALPQEPRAPPSGTLRPPRAPPLSLFFSERAAVFAPLAPPALERAHRLRPGDGREVARARGAAAAQRAARVGLARTSDRIAREDRTRAGVNR